MSDFTPTEGQPFNPAVSPLSDPLSNPKEGTTHEGTQTKRSVEPTGPAEDEPEEKDEQRAGEPPAEDEDDDPLDASDEDLAKKVIPYKRFKQVNEKVKELTEKQAELDLPAKAWNELKSHPKFLEIMGQFMKEADAPDTSDVDLSKLNVSEMSDGDIFDTAAKLGFQRARQHFEPIINQMRQQLQGLVQGQQTNQEGKFFSDKQNYPYADRFKADIKKVSAETGLSLEQAYYVVTGPKLVRYGKDLGIREATRKGNAPHITGRSSQGQAREGKIYSSIAQAFNDAKAELGM